MARLAAVRQNGGKMSDNWGRGGDPVLSVRGLANSYHDGRKEHEVLKNIGPTVARSECLALLGRSGSGKSASLKLLAGIRTAQCRRCMFPLRYLLNPDANAAPSGSRTDISFDTLSPSSIETSYPDIGPLHISSRFPQAFFAAGGLHHDGHRREHQPTLLARAK
jgi:hypothetical protein